MHGEPFVDGSPMKRLLREALEHRELVERDTRLQVMLAPPEVVAGLALVDDLTVMPAALNLLGDDTDRPGVVDIVFSDRWSMAVATGRGEALAG